MKDHERRERDIRILRDYLSGMKRADIAAKYGLVRSTIYHRVDMLVLRHQMPGDMAAKMKAINALTAKLKELKKR